MRLRHALREFALHLMPERRRERAVFAARVRLLRNAGRKPEPRPFAKYAMPEWWERERHAAMLRAWHGLGPAHDERLFFGTKSLEEMLEAQRGLDRLYAKIYNPLALEALVHCRPPFWSIIEKTPI